jgi:hypothetical protein
MGYELYPGGNSKRLRECITKGGGSNPHPPSPALDVTEGSHKGKFAMLNDEKRADILYAHYKDSFENIQNHIKKRERFLFFLLILSVIMIFQIACPAEAPDQLACILLKKLDLNKPISVAFIDTVIWFIMLSLIIRYCQTVSYIERQYAYIQEIEKKINTILGNEYITREGKAYLTKYPIFSTWVHYLYTVVFPILLIILLILRMKSEYDVATIIGFKIYLDFAIFILCIVSIFLFGILLYFKR